MTLTGIGSIDGAGGADTITGTNLADVLTGGAGPDTLTRERVRHHHRWGRQRHPEGGNADTFRFETGFGADTINGFDANPPDRQRAARTGWTSAPSGSPRRPSLPTCPSARPAAGQHAGHHRGRRQLHRRGRRPRRSVAQRVTIDDFILAP